jgi:hypothetical protein
MRFLELAFSYYFRIAAAVMLLAFTVFATSSIGDVPRTDPLTWVGAWKVAASMLAFMLVAFLAGRESKQGQK